MLHTHTVYAYLVCSLIAKYFSALKYCNNCFYLSHSNKYSTPFQAPRLKNKQKTTCNSWFVSSPGLYFLVHIPSSIVSFMDMLLSVHLWRHFIIFLTNLGHLEIPFYACNKVTSLGLLVKSFQNSFRGLDIYLLT